jgi:hypothetical protein
MLASFRAPFFSALVAIVHGCGPATDDADAGPAVLPSPTTAMARVEILEAIPGATFDRPSDCDANVSAARDAITAREAGLVATRTARLFYVYHPHTGGDPNAPLLVFWNGGPHAPTSPYLFAGGTAQSTVIWERAALAAPMDNAASWARFAHLLYIDAPGTGYSYPTVDPRTTLGPAHDAAEFVIAILTFLDCRMDRPDRAVALVGESYGGVRAHHVLWHLHHPSGHSDRVGDPGFGVNWTAGDQAALETRIGDHFARVASGRGETYTSHEPEVVARQFFGQVLIQPALLFDVLPHDWEPVMQITREGSLRLAEIGESREGELGPAIERGRTAVLDETESRTMFGVRLEDIPWMSRDSRTFFPWAPYPDGPPDQQPPDPVPHYLDAIFGELPAGYAYFDETRTLAANFEPPAPPDVYLDGLSWTSTLLTDAVFDRTVVSRALPEILEMGGLTRQSRFREGWVDLELVDGTLVSIRMPRFDAGHNVPMFTPRQIADEVERWLAELRTAAP